MLVNKSLVIIGCGGHARSVADVALSNGHKKLIFIDEQARKDEKLFEFDVSNDFSILDTAENIVVGVGDNYKREVYYKRFSNGYILTANSAYIGYHSTVGAGTFIGHNAHIGPMVKIGENNIINTHTVIEHECIIGNNSHISVNAVVAGRCMIGDFVFIGAGAVINDKVTICSNVTIGSGTVVVKDICKPGVYVGIPAKKIK